MVHFMLLMYVESPGVCVSHIWTHRNNMRLVGQQPAVPTVQTAVT
jgi:hypothetical protein